MRKFILSLALGFAIITAHTQTVSPELVCSAGDSLIIQVTDWTGQSASS